MIGPQHIGRVIVTLMLALLLLAVVVGNAKASTPATPWCLNVFWKDGAMYWRPGVMGGPCRYTKHEVDV